MTAWISHNMACISQPIGQRDGRDGSRSTADPQARAPASGRGFGKVSAAEANAGRSGPCA
jgi:hypothetical protein